MCLIKLEYIKKLTGLAANFCIQVPILDYEVVLPSDSKNNHYEIKVNNYGNAPAEHVLIYLEENGTKFQDFSSNPYLSKHFTEKQSSAIGNGKGFVEIENVPAFSRTDITAEVNTSTIKNQDDSELTAQVRSDETVGKRNTYILGLYYGPMLVVFLVIPILFWTGKIGRTTSNTFRIILFVAEGVALGALFVSFYYRA